MFDSKRSTLSRTLPGFTIKLYLCYMYLVLIKILLSVLHLTFQPSNDFGQMKVFLQDFSSSECRKDINVTFFNRIHFERFFFQSKLNCEVLWDDFAYEVRWAVAGDSVVLQLVARLGSYKAKLLPSSFRLVYVLSFTPCTQRHSTF